MFDKTLRARCIDIRDKNGNTVLHSDISNNTGIDDRIALKQITYEDDDIIIVLKTSDGRIIEYNKEDLIDDISNEKLYIKNIDIKPNEVIQLDRTAKTCLNELLFDDSQESKDEAIKIFEKARLIGACDIDEDGCIRPGIHNIVTINDMSNTLKSNIIAKEIYFVGYMYLLNMSLHTNIALTCNKVVIKNPCVMRNLVPVSVVGGLNSKIEIRSNNVTISHRFIDVNTPIEFLDMYDIWYTEQLRDNLTIWDNCYIAFKKQGVDLQRVRDEVLKAAKFRVKLYKAGKLSIYLASSTLHWVCDMWHSTDNNFCEILTCVDEIAGLLGDYKNVIDTSVFRDGILVNIKPVLDRYIRCLGEV